MAGKLRKRLLQNESHAQNSDGFNNFGVMLYSLFQCPRWGQVAQIRGFNINRARKGLRLSYYRSRETSTKRDKCASNTTFDNGEAKMIYENDLL